MANILAPSLCQWCKIRKLGGEQVYFCCIIILALRLRLLYYSWQLIVTALYHITLFTVHRKFWQLVFDPNEAEQGQPRWNKFALSIGVLFVLMYMLVGIPESRGLMIKEACYVLRPQNWIWMLKKQNAHSSSLPLFHDVCIHLSSYCNAGGNQGQGSYKWTLSLVYFTMLHCP